MHGARMGWMDMGWVVGAARHFSFNSITQVTMSGDGSGPYGANSGVVPLAMWTAQVLPWTNQLLLTLLDVTIACMEQIFASPRLFISTRVGVGIRSGIGPNRPLLLEHQSTKPGSKATMAAWFNEKVS